MPVSSPPLAALALVASLRAALTAGRAVADRRAGLDASAQEPPPHARAALAAAAGRLARGLVRLRVRLALGAPPDEAAALVQAFEDRLLAADLAADLADAHRRLLSLYPAVGAEAVEAVRLAHTDADRLAGADDFEADVLPFADRLAALLPALADA
jgi:hypothetical protein